MQKQTQPMEWEKVVIPSVHIGAAEQSKQTQTSPLILRVKENLHPKDRDGTS
jgi:hypothetical protein